MEVQAILNYLDEMVFAQTGKHLDTLQKAILKGVLDGQKYAQIAEKYHCSAGHVKDEAYQLWHILSDVLGEDLNKSNFHATIERLGFANFQSPIIGNKVRVGNINLCSNSSSVDEPSALEKNFEQVDRKHSSDVETAQRITKSETIPRLVKLGLTVEQIAQVLDLPLDEVEQAIQ